MVIDALQSWLSDDIPRVIERACGKHQRDLVIPPLSDWIRAALRSLLGDTEIELRRQVVDAIKPFEIDDLISDHPLEGVRARLGPSLALRALEARGVPLEEIDGAFPSHASAAHSAELAWAIGLGEVTLAWCLAACEALGARRRGRRHRLAYAAFLDAVRVERERTGASLRLDDAVDAWALATNEPASRASLRARWRRYLDEYRTRADQSGRVHLAGLAAAPTPSRAVAFEPMRSPAALGGEWRGACHEGWMTEAAVDAVLTAATFTLTSVEEHRRSTIATAVAQAVAGERLALVSAPLPPQLRRLFARLVAVADALAARGRPEALREIVEAVAPDSIDDVLADQPYGWTRSQLEIALRWRAMCRRLVEPTPEVVLAVLGPAGNPAVESEAIAVALDDAYEAIGSSNLALTRFLAVARQGRSAGRPADLDPSSFIAAVHVAWKRRHGGYPRERDVLGIWCLATGDARSERLRAKWGRYFQTYRPAVLDADLAASEARDSGSRPDESS